MSPKKESFVLLPDRVILSRRMQTVSPHARWMLAVMLTRWRRGEAKEMSFTYTYEEINNDTGYRHHRISSCLKELVAAEMIGKEGGGLECNKNSFTVDWEWLAHREVRHKLPQPLNWTAENGKSLMPKGKIIDKIPERALSVELDVEKLLN